MRGSRAAARPARTDPVGGCAPTPPSRTSTRTVVSRTREIPRRAALAHPPALGCSFCGGCAPTPPPGDRTPETCPVPSPRGRPEGEGPAPHRARATDIPSEHDSHAWRRARATRGTIGSLAGGSRPPVPDLPDDDRWVLKRLKNTSRLGRSSAEALKKVESARIPRVEEYSLTDPAYLVYPHRTDTRQSGGRTLVRPSLGSVPGRSASVMDAHWEDIAHRDIRHRTYSSTKIPAQAGLRHRLWDMPDRGRSD